MKSTMSCGMIVAAILTTLLIGLEVSAQKPPEAPQLKVECGANVRDVAHPPVFPRCDEVTKEAGYDYEVGADVRPWKYQPNRGFWYVKSGDLQFTITVPEKTVGTIRLFFYCPKAEVRVQEVFVEGKKIGTFESAKHVGKGEWIEAKYSADDSSDGKIAVSVKNIDEKHALSSMILAFEVHAATN